MINCTFMTTCTYKLKHLKDTQRIRNGVYNHQDELWEVLYHRQNNSKLIDQEDIVISHRRQHY